ncbi:hypothetical protein TRFO_15577 [Tritrichomonas foetus]|uniref:Uncharacterized protein n=1 Tax=Tritrichomonas foetus TaxID=1144522 RepID=A0A1J4KWJ0_9EUKA|nr:hypothetical protein TRFO_15577 [Tritrichomonas foetus]|eukprot:OHT14070.1 hypothetical protein TRFO_15577 [Tritrichomonas foetus]
MIRIILVISYVKTIWFVYICFLLIFRLRLQYIQMLFNQFKASFIFKSMKKLSCSHTQCQCCNIVIMKTSRKKRSTLSETKVKSGISKSTTDATKLQFKERKRHNFKHAFHTACHINHNHSNGQHSPEKLEQNSESSVTFSTHRHKIHKIGPKSIFIADPSKAFAVSFSDCCYELVCGNCLSRFKMMLEASFCYLQESENNQKLYTSQFTSQNISHHQIDENFQNETNNNVFNNELNYNHNFNIETDLNRKIQKNNLNNCHSKKCNKCLSSSHRSLNVDLPLQLRKYLNFDYNVFMYSAVEEEKEMEEVDPDNFMLNDSLIVGSFQQSSLLEFSHFDIFE